MPVRELIVGTKCNLAAKKYTLALTVSCNSYPRAATERFLLGEMTLSLLLAAARLGTGDAEGAMSDFEKAYRLSFNGVFEMAFVELGKDLHPLVVAALKHGGTCIPTQWLRMIDRKASVYTKKAAVVANAFKDRVNASIPVSLSDRETEVLGDLYHGLSREEIATNRFLSINTVKKILQSIYIKLDAYNNVDAIRIALERGIL